MDKPDVLCSIPTCTCGTLKEILHFQQNQKTIKFLMGLNEVYSTLQGHILLMDPLSTINKAHFLILLGWKTTKNIEWGHIIDKSFKLCYKELFIKYWEDFYLKNFHQKYGTCDKIGHTSEACQAHLKCDYCGWQGHTIDVCRKL